MNLGTCVDFDHDCTQVTINSTSEGEPLKFSFDQIFPPSAPQAQVYETAAKPIVESVLEGFNGTVFAYGQTGSGKTFTMTGANVDDESLKGIIPRMVSTVFQKIRTASDHLEYTVKIGYCEVYMERVKDLLNPAQNNLKIREDNRRGVYIADLSEEYISEESEVYNLMKLGSANREVAATHMNEGSSRSHSIFIMTISQNNTIDFSAKTGKLYLVDLAGSEKVGKTGAEGKRLDEAKTINKSLSALGMVITALTDSKSAHVPYRDSKLTRILQDSLGGNSKTSLIITCSPSPYNEAETISTLRFGTRAKQIKNKPKVNKEYTVAELKLLLSKSDAEIARKERRIQCLERSILDGGGTLPLEEFLDTEEAEAANKTPILPSAEMEEMHQELEDTQKLLAEQVAESERLRIQLSESAASNKKLLVQRDNLNLQLQQLLTNFTHIEELNQDLEMKLQTALFAKENGQKELTALEKTQSDLQEKIAMQEGEIAQLQLRLQSMNSQVSSPIKRWSSMKRQQKDSLGSESEFEPLYKDVEMQCFLSPSDNVENESHKNAELAEELTRLKSTLEQMSEGRVSNFDEFEAFLRRSVSEQLREQFDRERAALTKEIRDLTEHNEELSCSLLEANSKFDQLAKEKTDDQRSTKVMIRELVEQCKKTNRAYEDQKSLFQIQLNSLEKKLRSRDTRVESVEKELDQLRREVKEFRDKEISELEEEAQSIQPKLKPKMKRPVKKNDKQVMLNVKAYLSLGLSPATPRNDHFSSNRWDEEERKE